MASFFKYNIERMKIKRFYKDIPCKDQLKNEDEIDFFRHTNTKKFTSIPPQEIWKVVLQVEGNNSR